MFSPSIPPSPVDVVSAENNNGDDVVDGMVGVSSGVGRVSPMFPSPLPYVFEISAGPKSLGVLVACSCSCNGDGSDEGVAISIGDFLLLNLQVSLVLLLLLREVYLGGLGRVG